MFIFLFVDQVLFSVADELESTVPEKAWSEKNLISGGTVLWPV
jgi:hypothetical protein